MLRAVTRQQIRELLENSYFGLDNYVLEFGGDTSDLTFRAQFRADPSFEFIAKQLNFKYFQTIETPGERFISADEFRFEHFDHVIGHMTQWLDRVKQEVVSAIADGGDLLDLRVQFEQRMATVEESLNGCFSKIEAEAIGTSLSALIEAHGHHSDQTADLPPSAELTSKALHDLNEAIYAVNRGTWYRMACGRLVAVVKTVSRSNGERASALEATRKFLLEAMEPGLSSNQLVGDP